MPKNSPKKPDRAFVTQDTGSGMDTANGTLALPIPIEQATQVVLDACHTLTDRRNALSQGGAETASRAQQGPPRVVLGQYGEPVLVLGRCKHLKSLAAFKLVKALVKAGEEGLSKGQLMPISTDFWRILKGLKESDADWEAVIFFPGKPHGRYRVR